MGRKAAFLSIVELWLGFGEDLVRKLHLGGSVAKQCDGRKDAKALISMKLSMMLIKKLMSQCIAMLQVLIVEEPSSEPKETKPANLVMLKTAASSLRDSIVQVKSHRQCHHHHHHHYHRCSRLQSHQNIRNGPKKSPAEGFSLVCRINFNPRVFSISFNCWLHWISPQTGPNQP